MTALSEIGKAHAVAVLRGSDLEEFNEAHPRNQAGQFTAVAGAPAAVDPRAQRMARRGRRLRRINRTATAVAAQAEEAKADPRALQALHRERIKPTHQQARQQAHGVKHQQGAPKQEEQKHDLEDLSYLDDVDTLEHRVATPGFVLVDRDHVEDFLPRRAMVVGAANAKWGSTLEAMTEERFADVVASQVDPEHPQQHGMVALRLQNPFYANDIAIQPRTHEQRDREFHWELSEAQILHAATEKENPRGFTDTYQVMVPRAPDDYVAVNVPIIDVESSTIGDWRENLRNHDIVRDNPALSPTSKAASATTWDEDEHHRDPRSGRFASAGGGAVVDPRVARDMRRKRRLRRVAAAQQAVEQTAPVEHVRERALLAHRNERVNVRSNPRAGRPRLREVGGTPEQPPKPPKRSQGRLVYGDEGAGGRIVSEETFAAMQRGPKERITGYAPSSERSRPKTVEVVEDFGASVPMKESVALGAAPRFDLVDEYGNHLNIEELRAYAAAKQRARARKAKRPPS